MIFETERLILRPWEESDAEDLYKYAKDPDIAINSGWMPHKSIEESLEILKTVLSEPENYAICLKSDNVAIGCIALINRDGKLYTDEKHELEIGYWIGKPFWGMGLVPEAVYRMQQRAFFDLDCTALWCGYYEGNERSHRVMEKSGFRYHHTEKDIFVKELNDNRTEILTYLTKEEWEKGYTILPLTEKEIKSALKLTWEVFLQFEAPEYSQEGVEFFKNAINDEEKTKLLKFYGAFSEGKIVGTICMREPQHIGGFFVKAEYQRRGIGRALFERMSEDYETKVFTVNSSPYAVKIYEKLGFVKLGNEETVNGLRFTPMKYEH